MKYSFAYAVIVLLASLSASNLPAASQNANDLAAQYASCAAYYLMISKADPRLKKYGQIGVAAADNARRLSTTDLALAFMATETKRLLKLMDHSWDNAGVIIKQRSEPCKKLMTVNE